MRYKLCLIEKTLLYHKADNSDMFYKWETTNAYVYDGSCVGGGSVTIQVYDNNGTLMSYNGIDAKTQSGSGLYPNTLTTKDKLIYLFPFLQANILYTFKMTGSKCGSTFTFQKEITVQPAINRKVGGLRIQKITSNDGISTANDVSKTYKYIGGGTGSTNMSSGQLYNKPVYGYVFPGTTHGCNGRPANINTQHFWIEHSIVPLGGFEGNHIGYGLVQEYYKAAGTGYYTPLVRCVRKFLYFTSECQVCVAREQLSCDTYYTLRLRRA